MRVLLAPCLMSLVMLTAPAASVGDITISSVSESVHTDKIQFSGSYPQFGGMRNADQQRRLNATMREWEQASLVRAKSAVLTLPSGDGPRRVEGVYGYEVKRNGGGYASLLFSDYLYAGGANGLDVRTGFTIRTSDGEEVALKDLFENDASYLDCINTEIRKQLRERNLEKDLLQTFRGIDDSQNFYLTDSELVIVAGELTWFPHFMGTVEFPIPFTSISSCLKESII